MSNWLREPLLHFAALGVAIFGLYAWTRPARIDERPLLEVPASQVQRLAEIWRRQWQRPPTEDELRAVVEQHVREEILYRQALAHGLDKDDSMIRQRLAQKMQFLSEDTADVAEPDEATLRRFFAEHAATYVEPPVLTFSHVYFSHARRGAAVDADAKLALAVLARDPQAAAELGDPFVLPFEFTRASAVDVASQFGLEFAAALCDVPPGTWHGPVASTYGAHLVLVTERSERRQPELAEVRTAVLRDYHRAQRDEANRRQLDALRAGYQIVVDDAAIRATAGAAVAQAQR